MNNNGIQKKFSGNPNCSCANTIYLAQAIQ